MNTIEKEIKKRKRFIIGLVLSIILVIVLFFFDIAIVKIVEQSRTSYLDYLFISIGFASNVFIIFFFLTSLFLWSSNKRRWILPLWLSGALSVIVSYVLKVIIRRARPFQMKIITVLNIAFNFIKDNYYTWNFSFPSFQAMFVFSALPILSKQYKRFKYIWLIFACLVAFSRVYFGVHYLSDVLAGAIIGYLIGTIMVFVEQRHEWGSKLIRKLKIKRK
jgi:undecaprenyl-diphosphatase